MPEAYKFNPTTSFAPRQNDASDEVNIIAIITPAEGKEERLEQLISKSCEYVEANEPGTLAYHFHREISKEGGEVNFIMIERYKNAEAFEKHQQSPIFHEIGQIFLKEEILGKPLAVFTTQPVAGFLTRGYQGTASADASHS